jgi:hypothetical protein
VAVVSSPAAVPGIVMVIPEQLNELTVAISPSIMRLLPDNAHIPVPSVGGEHFVPAST